MCLQPPHSHEFPFVTCRSTRRKSTHSVVGIRYDKLIMVFFSEGVELFSSCFVRMQQQGNDHHHTHSPSHGHQHRHSSEAVVSPHTSSVVSPKSRASSYTGHQLWADFRAIAALQKSLERAKFMEDAERIKELLGRQELVDANSPQLRFGDAWRFRVKFKSHLL